MREKFNLFFKKNEIFFDLIAIIATITSVLFLTKVSFSNIQFTANFVKVLFNFIIFNVGVFTTIINLNFKYRHLIKQEVVFSFIVTSLTLGQVTQHNEFLNSIFFVLIPLDIVRKIIESGTALFWVFLVIFLNIIINQILLYFIKDTKTAIDQIQSKKMINNGILIYCVLTISVWVFTHFSYVAANSLYIAQEMKIIDSIVETGVKNNSNFHNLKINVYDIKEFNKFKDDTFKEYLKEPHKSNEFNVLSQWLNIIQLYNIGEAHDKKFSEISDFWGFSCFLFNSTNEKIGSDKIMISGLIYPRKQDYPNSNIKHGYIYIKIANNKLYTYVSTNSRFKDNYQNLIFNEFYTLFHLLFWILFFYIYTYHRKNVFKKESQEKDL